MDKEDICSRQHMIESITQQEFLKHGTTLCQQDSAPYPLAGWRQFFQQEGDSDLQQSLPEELLSHGAAVIVKLL